MAAGRRLRTALAVVVALAGVALQAPAETADPEEDPLYRLPHPGPLGVGLGWDEGVVYGVDRPVKIRGRLGASLDLDGGWIGGDLDGGAEGAIRRGKFHTLGKLHHWAGPEYKFEFDVEDGDVFLNDFYLRWQMRGRWVDDLKAGYFDPPTSLAALGSSSARSLMELPAPAAAFAPGYRLGAQVRGTRAQPDLSWAFNLSTVGQSDQNESDASESLLRATGRIVWRPWHDEEEEKRLLHLGLSAGLTISGSGGLRFRARPESFLADFLVDTGDISGDAQLLALEAAWRSGALSVQGEVFRAFLNTGDGDAQLGGAYLQVGRVLTGEFRPYQRGSAVFGRLEPRRPLEPRQGGWGALELTGRVSWLDLDDGSVRGGRMLTTQLGLVWTWNRFVRVHAGWVFAHADGVDGATDAHVIQSRLEVRF